MAPEPVLRRHSLGERLHLYWSAVSATAVGDIVGTVIAVAGMCVLFGLAAFALTAIARAGAYILHLIGT